MLPNVVVSNPKRLLELKEAIAREGTSKLHVLSDFDRTLTCAFVGGKSRPSLVSVLRDTNFLGADYAKKAHALFDKYHAIEIDTKISLREKKLAMLEWWHLHFDLLIKSGLNKKYLQMVVYSGKVKFRQGALALIDFLHLHNIPLVVLSSSGLGADTIALFFEKEKRLTENIFIVSNAFEWDNNGNAIGFKEPIIHSFSKDEAAIKNLPFFEKIQNRKNVLLLGDSIGDIGMIKGFGFKNLIKIGFLNSDVKKNLRGYKKNFDVIILNDSSMDFVNALLQEMAK